VRADTFKNIRIQGVDSDSITKSSDEPRQYILPFSLTDTPSEEWIALFVKEWRDAKKHLPRDYSLRNVQIVGADLLATIDYEVISADPFTRFDFSKPLENLKEMLKRVNDTYRQHLRREDEEIQALKEMTNNFKF
jgi:hypothetical protein